MLKDKTKWLKMEKQMPVPDLVSVVGLYSYYIQKDFTEWWNSENWTQRFDESFWDDFGHNEWKARCMAIIAVMWFLVLCHYVN